jgi:peptidyl-prolyl cis-trans isomerase B (cyclophilin B)
MMSIVSRRLALLLTAAALVSTVGACVSSGAGATSEVASPGPSTGTATGGPSAECPTEQPPALADGETRTVAVGTEKGTIVIKLEADLSPIAVGNFAALVSCGYYDGVVFHRVVPGFVIQGGDPTGTGTGGPGYTIKDEPVTTVYERGTVAMARTSDPDSVGSQFFIVLDDEAATALADPSTNNYQIIGSVTSGMETVDAIAAMPNSGEPNNEALDPVAMTTVTIANP